MAKRKITPERLERRKQLTEFLQGVGITDVAGVQELFKSLIASQKEKTEHKKQKL